MLNHEKAAEALVASLKAVFGICRLKGRKLNPLKCKFVANRAQFCGRIIDAKGIKFNPRHYKALTSMDEPKTVGALMELVHSANWMRTAIPRYSELIEPQHNLLEAQYSKYNPRKKSGIANRPLSAW